MNTKLQYIIANTDINLTVAKTLSPDRIEVVSNLLQCVESGDTLDNYSRAYLYGLSIRHINFNQHKDARAFG